MKHYTMQAKICTRAAADELTRKFPGFLRWPEFNMIGAEPPPGYAAAEKVAVYGEYPCGFNGAIVLLKYTMLYKPARG